MECHTLANAQCGDARSGRVDASHDLMAGDNRYLRMRQFTIHYMQIGTADAAGADSNANLARAGLSIR